MTASTSRLSSSYSNRITSHEIEAQEDFHGPGRQYNEHLNWGLMLTRRRISFRALTEFELLAPRLRNTIFEVPRQRKRRRLSLQQALQHRPPTRNLSPISLIHICTSNHLPSVPSLCRLLMLTMRLVNMAPCATSIQTPYLNITVGHHSLPSLFSMFRFPVRYCFDRNVDGQCTIIDPGW